MKAEKVKVDRVKVVKEKEKNVAIRLVTAWAQQMLQNYKEPVRAGTPKGEPIGLSRQKYEAALLQVLHPNCLRLKEIAAIVGVSEGMLKFWRTEDGFLKVVRQTSTAFGEGIANTIISLVFKDAVDDDFSKGRTTFTIDGVGKDAGDVAHFLIRSIPFYNGLVAKTIFAIFNRDLKSTVDPLKWGMVVGAIEEAISVHDDKSRREFASTPEMVLLAKLYISEMIDLLANPETWEKCSQEKIQEIAEYIKEVISNRLDILAQ